jgi:hypothetical protein
MWNETSGDGLALHRPIPQPPHRCDIPILGPSSPFERILFTVETVEPHAGCFCSKAVSNAPDGCNSDGNLRFYLVRPREGRINASHGAPIAGASLDKSRSRAA